MTTAVIPDSLHDDDRKLRFFNFAALVSIPILFGFLVINVSKWYLPGIFLDLAIALVFVVTHMLLRSNIYKNFVYRFLLLSVAGAFIYGIKVGGGEGTMLLWMFMLPLLYFFYFGIHEGLIWSVLTAMCAGLVLLIPEPLMPELYGNKVSYRFLMLFSLVTGLSYGLEYSRKFYSDKLLAQRKDILRDNDKLEQILTEINMLRGLLPICSGCKKIRIEKYIWEDVDNYIANRSSVKFSHSICPGCAGSLFLEPD